VSIIFAWNSGAEDIREIRNTANEREGAIEGVKRRSEIGRKG
jgi:hypothetical protein